MTSSCSTRKMCFCCLSKQSQVLAPQTSYTLKIVELKEFKTFSVPTVFLSSFTVCYQYPGIQHDHRPLKFGQNIQAFYTYQITVLGASYLSNITQMGPGMRISFSLSCSPFESMKFNQCKSSLLRAP